MDVVWDIQLLLSIPLGYEYHYTGTAMPAIQPEHYSVS